MSTPLRNFETLSICMNTHVNILVSLPPLRVEARDEAKMCLQVLLRCSCQTGRPALAQATQLLLDMARKKLEAPGSGGG